MKRFIFLLSLTTAFMLIFSTGCKNPSDSDDDKKGPENITLSNASIGENVSSGTLVGTISATGLDSADTVFTFSLVDGDSSDGNASFTISGDSLLTNATFDYTIKSSYLIRIQAENQNGGKSSKGFVISLTEIKEALGIFSESVTSYKDYNSDMEIKIFEWESGITPTLTLDSECSDAFEGSVSMKMTGGAVGWAGGGWTSVESPTATVHTSDDYSEFASCTLHVAMKGNVPAPSILVEQYSGGTQHFEEATDWGYVPDSGWAELNIPLSEWSGVDFSAVSYLFAVSFGTFTEGDTLLIDDLYWTLPAAE